MNFCKRELARGWPVIVGLRRRKPAQYYAALAIGVEGLQRQRTFSLRSLLLLDPTGTEPECAACNARLEFGKTKRVTYATVAGAYAVAVDGAVSIRLLKPGLPARAASD